MTPEPSIVERSVFVSGDKPDEADGQSAKRFRRPARRPDFEALYEAHAARLLAFLVYRTGDHALAEDLLSDTFERVLRAKRRFDPGRGTEKTWLYAIAINCLRDNARRVSAEARALERSGAGRSEPAHQEPGHDALADRDLLRCGLASLSDDERLAVALRYGADLTMPEIARLVREPLTTVEARVYRALEKLRGVVER